jgi:polyhydroxybutyrate depolymerase
MPSQTNPQHSFIFKAFSSLITVLFVTISVFAKDKPLVKHMQQPKPQVMEWTIAGVTRKALVYIPATAKTKPTPILFTYHGHGGSMQHMYDTRGFDKLWPEAIFICPQGLKTVGKLTDPEGNLPGWLMDADSVNRDLKFFDAMLATLQKDYKVDTKRIYATGHSNGGGFTYLLWAMRGDVFAAVAPSASVGGKLTTMLKPKPAMHIMGDADPLVKPEWQRLTCNYLLRLNKCEKTGKKLADYVTEYPSAIGTPFVWYDHPGGHIYPQEANQVVIDFFKRYAKD